MFKKSNNKRILYRRWFLRFLPIELFDRLKIQQIKSIGSILTVFVILFPIFIWLSYRPDSILNPYIAIAKFSAFMAISTLAVNFILASRIKIFEKLFHGLDRLYRVHKLIGRLSLFFMILHPIFLGINTIPEWEIIITYVIPTGPIEVSLGIVAIYLFLILIALSVALIIPYHWWKRSHQFLGLTLLFAALHAIFAGSDINSYYYLKFWVIFICTIGSISWLYMLLFYKRLGPRYMVKILMVKTMGDITETTLEKPTNFISQPGQFLFIRFPRLQKNKELFPFSISNDPSQKTIRLSIKQSGDYTTKYIPKIKTGDPAIIMGPYGRFGERYLKHDMDMIWIAGGIGITPFLSLAKHESIHPTGRNIDLIWVIKNRDEVFHDHELINETKRNPNFSYVHWFSDKKGRITASDIIRQIGGKDEVKKRIVFLCGPPGLMYVIAKGLHKHGMPYRHIIFEDFNMLD